jgi:diguanylate cyclase (GGDEF)-like protein
MALRHFMMERIPPVKEPSEAQIELPPSTAATPARRRPDAEEQQIHVLLVKADPQDVWTMLEDAEKPLGVHFRVTAIDSVHSYPDGNALDNFDVIVLDLDQPGEDGFAAVHKLRFFAPALPIVALADAEQKGKVPRAVRHELHDILCRDNLTGTLLANSLHHVCERSRLAHALGSLPRDCRTGLYNRHFFSVMAEHYLRLAGRLKGIVVMYAVLDGIHRINPPLFHLEERRLLLGAARTIAKSFRTSDVLAHWGRHEFVALAVGAGPDHVNLISTRLQQNIDAHNETSSIRQRVQLSAGFITVGDADERSIGEMIGDADAARWGKVNTAKAS